MSEGRTAETVLAEHVGDFWGDCVVCDRATPQPCDAVVMARQVVVLTEAHNAEWALRFAEDLPRVSPEYHAVQDRWNAAQAGVRATYAERDHG